MIRLGVVESIRTAARPTRAWPIRRVKVDKFAAVEWVPFQKILSAADEELVPRIKLAQVFLNDGRITVDSDVSVRRNFVPEYCASSEVRFDVGAVGRDQVDQVMKARGFAAWIAHQRPNLVISDDAGEQELMICTAKRLVASLRLRPFLVQGEITNKCGYKPAISSQQRLA